MRIKEHPILELKKGKRVTFFCDNREIEGYDDEPIAVALFACGITTLSKSLKKREPRGIFCCIGNCSSCLMKVDGIPNVRTCTTRVKEGMRVETQNRGGNH
jgi:predicted molibdopterin-dependent oxidoreductase YjgC